MTIPTEGTSNRHTMNKTTPVAGTTAPTAEGTDTNSRRLTGNKEDIPNGRSYSQYRRSNGDPEKRRGGLVQNNGTGPPQADKTTTEDADMAVQGKDTLTQEHKTLGESDEIQDTTQCPNDNNQTTPEAMEIDYNPTASPSTPNRRNGDTPQDTVRQDPTNTNDRLKGALWAVPPTYVPPWSRESMKLHASFNLFDKSKGKWTPLIAMDHIAEALLATPSITGITPIGFGNEREETLPSTIATKEEIPQDQLQFEKYFKIFRSLEDKHSMICEFTILTKTTINGFKRGNKSLMEALHTHNCRLYEPSTKGEEMPQIGFMTHVVATRIDKRGYAEYVHRLFQEYCRNVDISSLQTWEEQELRQVLASPTSAMPQISLQTQVRRWDYKHPQKPGKHNVDIPTLNVHAPASQKAIVGLLLEKISSLDPELIGKYVPNNYWKNRSITEQQKGELLAAHAKWTQSVEAISVFYLHPDAIFELNEHGTSIAQMTRNLYTGKGSRKIIHSIEFTLDTFTENSRMIVLATRQHIKEAVDYIENVILDRYQHTTTYQQMPTRDQRRNPTRGKCSLDTNRYNATLNSGHSYSSLEDQSSYASKSSRRRRKAPTEIEISWEAPKRNKTTGVGTAQQHNATADNSQAVSSANSTSTEETSNTSRPRQATDLDTISTIDDSLTQTIESMISQKMISYENKLSKQQKAVEKATNQLAATKQALTTIQEQVEAVHKADQESRANRDQEIQNMMQQTQAQIAATQEQTSQSQAQIQMLMTMMSKLLSPEETEQLNQQATRQLRATRNKTTPNDTPTSAEKRSSTATSRTPEKHLNKKSKGATSSATNQTQRASPIINTYATRRPSTRQHNPPSFLPGRGGRGGRGFDKPRQRKNDAEGRYAAIAPEADSDSEGDPIVIDNEGIAKELFGIATHPEDQTHLTTTAANATNSSTTSEGNKPVGPAPRPQDH